MAERATIFQGVQIGLESTAGTGVAANKKLAALSIEPGIKLETNQYRAIGNKYRTVVVPGKEWTEAKFSGPLLYTDIVYVLSSMANYAAPVQQGGTAAYKWTFTPGLSAADTAKTFTVEVGSTERAHKFEYGIFTGCEMTFSRDACEISGDMIGEAIQDGITMTSTPTVIALTPVLPTQVNVKLADTQAGLAGASALTRCISASWALRNRFAPVFPLSSTLGMAAVVEIEPELEIKIKVEADAAGMALLTNMRAGSTKFIQIKGTGDLIAGAYYYDIAIEAGFKVTDVSPWEDEEGIYAIEFTGVGVYDATWTKTTQIDVINTLTAL